MMSYRIILDDHEKGVDAGREESLARIAELQDALEDEALDAEEDVLADWDGFWREIVCTDGHLDLAKVARELFDYHVAMKQVAITYCDITGNRFSKPNTSASHVIGAAYEYIEKPLLERAERAEAALEEATRALRYGGEKDLPMLYSESQAALAERDRMLRVLIAETVHGVERSPDGFDECPDCTEFWDTIRARAAEGSE